MASSSYTPRQIVGTSEISVDDAIARALGIASQNYGEPDWFDVVTARGFLSNGRVSHYQVTLALGYETRPGGSARAAGHDHYFRSACSTRHRDAVYHTIEKRF